jgi:hypothetical protein
MSRKSQGKWRRYVVGFPLSSGFSDGIPELLTYFRRKKPSIEIVKSVGEKRETIFPLFCYRTPTNLSPTDLLDFHSALDRAMQTIVADTSLLDPSFSATGLFVIGHRLCIGARDPQKYNRANALLRKAAEPFDVVRPLSRDQFDIPIAGLSGKKRSIHIVDAHMSAEMFGLRNPARVRVDKFGLVRTHTAAAILPLVRHTA